MANSISLAQVLSRLRPHFAVTADHNGELAAREAVRERCRAGLLTAVAGKAVGEYRREEIDRAAWTIPLEAWEHIEADMDAGWTRSVLRIPAFYPLGRARRLGSEGLLLVDVRLAAEGVDCWIAELPKTESERVGAAARHAEPAAIKRSGGRPPAPWWADFAEELAVYLHDKGCPEGTGREGQAEVISAVCARLTKRGKDEPSHSSIKPVVGNVLERLRSTDGN